MLALTYTHSRVSALEGTTPAIQSTNKYGPDEVEYNPYDSRGDAPVEYQPEDSLRKRRDASYDNLQLRPGGPQGITLQRKDIPQRHPSQVPNRQGRESNTFAFGRRS
jgi:hypothetical protein